MKIARFADGEGGSGWGVVDVAEQALRPLTGDIDVGASLAGDVLETEIAGIGALRNTIGPRP